MSDDMVGKQEAQIRRLLGLAKDADPFAVLEVAVPNISEESMNDPKGGGAQGLGVVAFASLKRAYRAFALLLHPDKCSLTGADDAFRVVDLASKRIPDEVSCARFLIQIRRRRQREAGHKRAREEKKSTEVPACDQDRKEALRRTELEERQAGFERRADDLASGARKAAERAIQDAEMDGIIAEQSAQWATMGFDDM